MKHTELPDGTYRLTAELDNPRIDRRYTRDWTMQHFKAGTVYHLQTWLAGTTDEYREIRQPFEFGQISKYLPAFDLLCAHFEPLEENATRYLSRVQASGRADTILDYLIETGQLSLDQVKSALTELDKRDSE